MIEKFLTNVYTRRFGISMTYEDWDGFQDQLIAISLGLTDR